MNISEYFHFETLRDQFLTKVFLTNHVYIMLVCLRRMQIRYLNMPFVWQQSNFFIWKISKSFVFSWRNELPILPVQINLYYLVEFCNFINLYFVFIVWFNSAIVFQDILFCDQKSMQHFNSALQIPIPDTMSHSVLHIVPGMLKPLAWHAGNTERILIQLFDLSNFFAFQS